MTPCRLMPRVTESLINPERVTPSNSFDEVTLKQLVVGSTPTWPTNQYTPAIPPLSTRGESRSNGGYLMNTETEAYGPIAVTLSEIRWNIVENGIVHYVDGVLTIAATEQRYEATFVDKKQIDDLIDKLNELKHLLGK